MSVRGSLETWGLGFNGMLTLFARLRMLLAQQATASQITELRDDVLAVARPIDKEEFRALHARACILE